MAIDIRSNEELSDSLTRIAGLLLSEEKLEAVLELCVSLTSRTLPGAAGVSVTLIRDDRFTTAVYSNEITRRVDAWQYATAEGPCLSAATEGERFHANDLASDVRWPRFAEMAKEEGVASVLAIPFSPMGEPIGTLNIYGSTAYCFEDDDVEIASMFAGQAAIVIANSVAYSSAQMANAQLNAALESREVIGQAKGILMERERCSADEAFGLLRGVSQRTNRKLRDVAQEIVDSVCRANGIHA
jgi:GAF domain-containing protein